MKDGTWSKNGTDEDGGPENQVEVHVPQLTNEELAYVLAGLAALRRDMRSEAGSLLVMFRVLKPEEKGAMVERADKLIEKSNEVNDLMERLAR